MSHKCLFLINGLGMGNSTRCGAVMEHLSDCGCQIHVVTSGNGLNYFKDKPFVRSLATMESFYYSGSAGGISGWSTLKSLPALLRIASKKRRQLSALIETLAPDVAIIDSEYAIAPLRRRGIPVIGLNTSEMVVTQYSKHRRAARGVSSQFWFVEYTDYLFHRHYCDLVLSPFPLRTPTRHPKFQRIGLVVREALKAKAVELQKASFPAPRELRTVVFMLSGSVHASHIGFEQHRFPFRIEVVGRSGESRGNVTFHGRQMDNTELLLKADALVINGGYSAVSEAFLLRKPVFVVPVPGHAEQFVNACLVRDLGIGFMATENDVLDQLRDMYEANQWVGLRQAPGRFELDGARDAAAAIMDRLDSQASSPLPARAPAA